MFQGVHIADVVGNSATIASVSVLLLGWAIGSGYFLWRGTGRLKKALSKATQAIKQWPDETSFALNYEQVAGRLKVDPVLGARWREYDDSLVLRQSPHPHYRSTTRAESWFNSGLARTVGVDLRYHAALPNLLVGAGLLFTFAGLAVALSSASGVVSGTAIARNSALQGLLDAASFKFITSLVGLLLSISYALFRKGRLKSLDKALDTFVAALEERVPLLTPVALQQEANHILREQADLLQTFSTDLALNLGQAIDRAFDARLGDHIGPLREAIERLSAGLSSHNEEAMQRMLDTFVKNLQAGASGGMEGVVESLQILGRELGVLQGGLKVAADAMTRSADDMAGRMTRGAEDSVTRLTQQIESMVTELSGLAEQSRAAGDGALSEMSARIAGAASSLEETAARVATLLQAAAGETGGAFGRGAQDAVARIADATEGMRTEMRGLIEEFRGAAVAAGETLRTGGASGAESLRSALNGAGDGMAAALNTAADRLARAGDDAGGALQRGGDAARSKLDEAGASFGGRADALSRQVAALTGATDGVTRRMSELERATHEAAAPLSMIASDLRAASDAAHSSVQPLVHVSDRIAQVSDSINGGMLRMQAMHDQAAQLAASLTGAAARFDGLDEELARVLGEMQKGLQSYASEVEAVVGKVDQHLGQAVTSLSGSITNLEETLVNFRLTHEPEPQ